jgi:hypothetical protein
VCLQTKSIEFTLSCVGIGGIGGKGGMFEDDFGMRSSRIALGSRARKRIFRSKFFLTAILLILSISTNRMTFATVTRGSQLNFNC